MDHNAHAACEVVIGLGSNVGNRAAQLGKAVQALREVLGGLRTSRVLESAAVLPAGAPAEWDMRFFNMAVCGYTEQSPLALLYTLKTLEQRLGRVQRGTWGPREIDIDILAMGATVWVSDALTLPHAQLLQRDFALLPLAELTPQWKYPLEGIYHNQTAAEIAARKGYVLNDALRDTGIDLCQTQNS